jgi:LmbE family N-acetylglucosaminyl deacetylase
MNLASIKNILVLAPHTDDGELGCGGTITKFSAQGIVVHYAAFSLCARSLPAGLEKDTLANECKLATKELGISPDNLRFFDFDVRNFSTNRQEILESLVVLQRELTPDLVFIPCKDDIHQDHRVIHEEGLRAFKNSSILGYELPWNHNRFNIGLFVELNEDELSVKKRALKMYKSQQARSYMKDDFIESLAKVRGVQSNKQLAEAFEVYSLKV